MSPTPLLPANGAIATVDKTPIALPLASRNALARVTGNPGGHGIDGVAPAVARVAEADAALRAELAHAEAQRRVAVAVDLGADGCRATDARRATPERDRRIDLGRGGGRQSDQRKIVVRADLSGFVSP